VRTRNGKYSVNGILSVSRADPLKAAEFSEAQARALVEILQAAKILEPEPPESELERIEQHLKAEPFVIEMAGDHSYRIERRDQCGLEPAWVGAIERGQRDAVVPPQFDPHYPAVINNFVREYLPPHCPRGLRCPFKAPHDRRPQRLSSEQAEILNWMALSASFQAACCLADVSLCEGLGWLETSELFRRKVRAYPRAQNGHQV
jgi:hypothetical protein